MLDDDLKLAVVLVGLPGRGKTYIASKLTRYLNWKGHKTKIFSTGQYRQKLGTEISNTHNFFDHSNSEYKQLRNQVVQSCFDDMMEWLNSKDGRVSIFDGSNITREWRNEIKEAVEKNSAASVIFIESICDDPDILKANLDELHRSLPDYKDSAETEAVEDFKQRIKHDEEVYEPMDSVLDSEVSFLKMINVNKSMITNNISGYLCTAIAHFLMNVHIVPRTIYVTRHGESEYNLEGKLGGDSELSPNGKKYSTKLYEYMSKVNPDNLQVWTSTLQRTIETGQYFKERKRGWRCLDEIDAGICDGLTYAEVCQLYPEEYKAREVDKYHYRYPRGESYHDIVVRLEPVMMELERAHNVLVIAHQAVLRCMLAYFFDKTCDELPYIKVPLHTIMKITPVAYGCRVEMIPFDIQAVSTHRPLSIIKKLDDGEFVVEEQEEEELSMKDFVNAVP